MITEQMKKVLEQVKKASGKGVDAARLFLVARAKEKASVPAPRKKMPDGSYRATTKAIPGAPLRKLSGRFRNSITSKKTGTTSFLIGANARAKPTRNYPQGFNYPEYHEIGPGNHKTIVAAINENIENLQIIVGGEMVKDPIFRSTI